MAKPAWPGGSVFMGIAEVLLERGLITSDHLSAAMELRKTEGLRLDRALVRLECIAEETLLRVMSEQLGVPMVDLTKVQIDLEALRSLPPRLVHRKGILPIKRENGVLVVATSDPFDLYAFDEIRLMTGLEIQPALACEEDIQKLIKAHFGIGGETLDEMMSTDDLEVVQDRSAETEDLLEMAQEASVVKLVNEVFLEAVN